MHWFFILPKTLILGPVWVSFGLKTSNKSLPKKVLKNYQNSMWQFFIQLEKPHFRSIFRHFGPKIPEQLKKKNLAPSFFTLGGILIHAENLKVLEVVLEKNSGQTDTYTQNISQDLHFGDPNTILAFYLFPYQTKLSTKRSKNSNLSI